MALSKWMLGKATSYVLALEFLGVSIAALWMGGFSIYSFYTACLWTTVPFAVTIGFFYARRWKRPYPLGMLLATLAFLLMYGSLFRESGGRGPGLAILIFQLVVMLPYMKSAPEITCKNHLMSYLLVLGLSYFCTGLVLWSIEPSFYW